MSMKDENVEREKFPVKIPMKKEAPPAPAKPAPLQTVPELNELKQTKSKFLEAWDRLSKTEILEAENKMKAALKILVKNEAPPAPAKPAPLQTVPELNELELAKRELHDAENKLVETKQKCEEAWKKHNEDKQAFDNAESAHKQANQVYKEARQRHDEALKNLRKQVVKVFTETVTDEYYDKEKNNLRKFGRETEVMIDNWLGCNQGWKVTQIVQAKDMTYEGYGKYVHILVTTVIFEKQN